MAFEYDPPTALSHFQPGDLLDALSIGAVVLDAQLCVIYANSAAQDALAFRVNQARGRPFGDFFRPIEQPDRVSRMPLPRIPL